MFVLRERTGGALRIDLLAVDEDLETTIVVRRKCERTNALFVFGEELLRQTDGFRLVTSRRAVFNANFHANLLI